MRDGAIDGWSPLAGSLLKKWGPGGGPRESGMVVARMTRVSKPPRTAGEEGGGVNTFFTLIGCTFKCLRFLMFGVGPAESGNSNVFVGGGYCTLGRLSLKTCRFFVRYYAIVSSYIYGNHSRIEMPVSKHLRGRMGKFPRVVYAIFHVETISGL